MFNGILTEDSFGCLAMRGRYVVRCLFCEKVIAQEAATIKHEKCVEATKKHIPECPWSTAQIDTTLIEAKIAEMRKEDPMSDEYANQLLHEYKRNVLMEMARQVNNL